MNKRYAFGAIGGVVVLAAGYWLLRPALPATRELGYVSERKVTVWNRLAMVREPVASLRYGDKVGIAESKMWNSVEYHRVVTPQKSVGWMEAKLVMPEAIWNSAAENLKKSKSMTPQGRGITKVPTNVRVEPGRSAPRSFQLNRDAPVEIFARQVVDLPPDTKKSDEPAGDAPAEPRREDWVFVRGHDADAGDLAGWVVARFLEPDLPGPLRDYAAGIRFVAWFELSRVPSPAPQEKKVRVTKPQAKERVAAEEEPAERPQYLAAGTTGPEGQLCDFTLLRFYTWHATRRRYETAYVESDLCGRLPIHVTPIPRGANLDKAEASFSFTALAPQKKGSTAADVWETREYRMKQNIIRRLRAKK